MGTSSKDGVVKFRLYSDYYLKHKEVLDKFMMKGTSASMGNSRGADLVTFINYSPIGGDIKIENDPAFISFLRLTGGL
jgi:hypothetical protein